MTREPLDEDLLTRSTRCGILQNGSDLRLTYKAGGSGGARERPIRTGACAAGQGAGKGLEAAEAETKRKAREEKVAYQTARAQEAVDRTSVTEHDVEQLLTLLRTAVMDGRPLTFDGLRQEVIPAPFIPPVGRTKAAATPRWEEYEPEPPRGLRGALGFGQRGYEAEVEAARERFDRALRDHARDEKKRSERLHAERNRDEATRIGAWNDALEQRRNAYRDRDVEAVEWFIDQVLAASTYPHGFPKAHQVSFQADTGDLLVEIDLPLEDVVPAARAYRYVKARDEMTTVPRPEKERKELYASVLAQTALRTVHELFAADTDGAFEYRVVQRSAADQDV